MTVGDPGQGAIWSSDTATRSAEQMRRNATLHREAISSDLWSELKAERLLREDAPVPE